MKQSAAVRPEPTFLRKAAIINGGVRDHVGKVVVEPIPNFDLNRTIFQTLSGAIPRYVMKTRVAKEVYWSDMAAANIQHAYDDVREQVELPEVSSDLMTFLVEECNFDVEHADGSFLDHLYFGFEYATQYYSKQSPLVMLLHSILGTGTNTFAMKADKIPDLRSLMNDFEWHQTESFPSILRLLYVGALRRELRENLHRVDDLKEIRFRRVIDNEPVVMSGEDLWIQLNYQLIHIIDFLPAANWIAHKSDTSFIIFRDLYDILDKAGKLEAHVNYTPADGRPTLDGEHHSFGSWLITRIPVSVVEKMAAKSIQSFSSRIGHSLDYEIEWA